MLKLSALVRLLNPCSFKRGSGLTTAVSSKMDGNDATCAGWAGWLRRRRMREGAKYAGKWPSMHPSLSRGLNVAQSLQACKLARGNRDGVQVIHVRIALPPSASLRTLAGPRHAGARSCRDATAARAVPPA